MSIEEKDQPAALRSSARWLRHVHVAESDRGAPGTGQTDWPAVMQALRDIRHDGWCVIESFAWDKPALAAATRSWRDLARSPDELVRDGLRFLRATHESTARSEQAP